MQTSQRPVRQSRARRLHIAELAHEPGYKELAMIGLVSRPRPKETFVMIGCPFGRRGIERRFCASKCWLIGLGVRSHCTVGRVKILHTAYRVTDLAASLDFYIALGYGEVGRVDIGDGASLTMLKFPGEEVVTLELVHRSASQPVSKRPVPSPYSMPEAELDILCPAVRSNN
jgi:hypothetical protein